MWGCRLIRRGCFEVEARTYWDIVGWPVENGFEALGLKAVVMWINLVVWFRP
jgi:hypothetical protein